MKLKYHVEIKASEIACNLSDFQEWEREAFRWVFADINDARNFKPIYILDSNRRESDVKRESYNCTGYAISLYNSQQSAKSKLLRIISGRPNAHKKLGTHIAQGELEHGDGISGKTNDSGHFDLFEYENVNLNSKFSIVEAIIT